MAMRCLVTAGPTWEPLDSVRRLTNLSTGTLGGELANFLARAGHEVRLLLSESATWRVPLAAVTIEPFSTTESLADRLRAHADAGPVAVFHAAAVSDFRGGPMFRRQADGRLEPVQGGKVDSQAGTLLVELRPTPKILPQLRHWFPQGRIIGWKYEVDGARAEALARGDAQLRTAGSDVCVVNGPAYGAGFGLVRPARPVVHLPGRPALYDALRDLL